MKIQSRSLRGIAFLCCSMLVLSGCVTTHIRNIEKFERGPKPLSVLFMPIDVELSEQGASGILEPKAAWTAKAKKNLETGIKGVFSGKKSELLPYSEPASDSEDARLHTQLIKLHSVVGTEMLFQSIRPLPTKEGKLTWTLGPDIKKLREATKADYALFVHMRDSYASAGRAATIFVAALVFGVGLPGGQKLGFASLVDLRTGKVVWFNRVARGSGDLRTPHEAQETINVLMKELPS